MVRNLNLIIKQHFDAAHFLEDYKGACANLHGHRWIVEVHLEVDDNEDLTIDFKEAKKIINESLPDHQCLNNLYDFNPTAENLAKHLRKEISEKLPVERLIVWETPECGACSL